MRWLLASVVLLGACRSGGGAIPPSRLDVAPVTMVADGTPNTGLHVAYGLHWASLSPSHDTDLDIGLGYIYQGFGDEDITALKAEEQPDKPTGGSYRIMKPLNVHGIYLEADRRIGRGDNHRTWAGLRGEALLGRVDHETRGGVGVTGRLSWEVYGTVKDRSAVGVLGIGAFIEAGARLLPDGRTAAQTLGGITVRLPAAATK